MGCTESKQTIPQTAQDSANTDPVPARRAEPRPHALQRVQRPPQSQPGMLQMSSLSSHNAERYQPNQPPLNQQYQHQGSNSIDAKPDTSFGLSPSSIPAEDKQVTTAQWPKRIERPEIGLEIEVWFHIINTPAAQPVPCWTFLSHGMESVNQPEVLLLLKQRQNESIEHFPLFPIEWMRVVYEFARMGVHIEDGQACSVTYGNPMHFIVKQTEVLGERSIWQQENDLCMFIHTFPFRCQSTTGAALLPTNLILPDNVQQVIALKAEEAAVAAEFGVTRVVSHLGMSVRWFPYPPWIDRERQNCCTMADQETSIRRNLKVARIYGIHLLTSNDEIVLSLPSDEEKKNAIQAVFRDSEATRVVALEGFMSRDADAGLTWKSGQTEPRGYSSNCGSGTNMNLAFLGLVCIEDDEKAIMVEDGYSLIVKPNTWIRILDAIANTANLRLEVADNITLRIEWRKLGFLNPIDGDFYPVNMRTYHPTNTIPDDRMRYRDSNVDTASIEPKSHVEIVTVILLKEPEPQFVSTLAIIRYFEDIREVLRSAIPATPPPGVPKPCQRLTYDLQLPPPAHRGLASQAHPSAAGIDVEELARLVMAVPLVLQATPPPDMLVYRIHLVFGLWGYDGKDLSFNS